MHGAGACACSCSLICEMDQPEVMQDKIKQLTEAVQGLTQEVKRLQSNLDQMHKLQATLLQVTQQMMQWAEKLDSRGNEDALRLSSTSTDPEQ